MLRLKKQPISWPGRQSKLARRLRDDRHTNETVLAQFASGKGDKFSEFVNQIELIARVTNGIALATGLVEGSIPADLIIAELLHMGSMKPDQLIKVNATAITAVMEAMKTTPAKFQKATGVEKVENRFLALMPVLRAKIDSAAFQRFSKKDEYLAQLDRLNSTLSGFGVEDTIQKCDSLKTSLKGVKNMKSGGNPNAAGKDANTLAALFDNMVEVEDDIPKYKKSTSLVSEISEKLRNSSFVQLLIDEAEARKHHKFYQSFPNDESMVVENFRIFGELAAVFQKDQELLEHFKTLADNLQSRQPGVKYTAALPNGMGDIRGLSADISDQVFRKIFNLTPKHYQDLRKGFQAFDQLDTNLQNVDRSWQPVMGKIDHAKNVLSREIGFANQTKHIDTCKAKLQALEECQRNHLKDPVFVDIADIDTVLKLIRNLDAEVSQLADSLNEDTHLEDLSVLKKVVDMSNINSIPEREAATPNIVNKLKSMPEVGQTIDRLTHFSNKTEKLNKISSNVKDINDKMGSIVDYHTKLVNTTFLKWNDCLVKKVGDDGEHIAKMIESIRELRTTGGQTNEIADAAVFLTTLVKSGSLLESALKSAARMKSLTDVEVKSFNLFQNSADVALKLGMATNGLTEIRRVYDSRQQLNALTGDVSFIRTAADKVTSQLTTVQYGVLTEFASLRTSLLAVYAKIDAMVNKMANSDLKSYKSVFDEAAKIQTMVNRNATEFKSAVAALVQKDPSIQNELNAVTASLATLEHLELDFSKFNFSDVTPALDNIEAFFVNWAKSLVPNNAVTVSVLTSTDPSQQGRVNTLIFITPDPEPVSATTDAGVLSAIWDTITSPLFFVPGAIVGVVGCAGCAGCVVVIVIRRRKKNKKNDIEDSDKEKKIEDSDKDPVEEEDDSAGGNPKQKKDKTKGGTKDNGTVEEAKEVKKGKGEGKEEGDEKNKGKKEEREDKKEEKQENKEVKEKEKDTEDVNAKMAKKGSEEKEKKEEEREKERETEEEKAKMVKKGSEKKEGKEEEKETEEEKEKRLSEDRRKAQQDKEILVVNTIFSHLLQCIDSNNITLKSCPLQRVLEGIFQFFPKVRDEEKNYDSRRRYGGVFCSRKGRVVLTAFNEGDVPPPFIHANEIIIKGILWIMTQGPLGGTKGGKKSTLGDFWMMVEQKNVKVITQLCQFVEDKVEKCGKYYPEVVGEEETYGLYTVKATKLVDATAHFTGENRTISVLTLEYTRKGEPPKTVDIVRYFEWPDHGFPTKTDALLELLKYVETYEGNVIVHCSAGIGRTGTLVALQYALAKCGTIDATSAQLDTSIIIPLRAIRYGAVQTALQALGLAVCFGRGIYKRWGIDSYSDDYYRILYYFHMFLRYGYTGGEDKEKEITKNGCLCMSEEKWTKDNEAREQFVKDEKEKEVREDKTQESSTENPEGEKKNKLNPITLSEAKPIWPPGAYRHGLGAAGNDSKKKNRIENEQVMDPNKEQKRKEKSKEKSGKMKKKEGRAEETKKSSAETSEDEKKTIEKVQILSPKQDFNKYTGALNHLANESKKAPGKDPKKKNQAGNAQVKGPNKEQKRKEKSKEKSGKMKKPRAKK